VGRLAGKVAFISGNYWQTRPPSVPHVSLHRLAAALELGDVAYVEAHAAKRCGRERTHRAGGFSHRIDMARAQTMAAHDDALQTLLAAGATVPQLVRPAPLQEKR
jgi:hypothetical protein